ncbi:MAG: ATP-binding cassette domain-containing protein [Neisseriaceae bacterium]|nr:ATP-binding cassette domain-containing protein [Neisseriaceae bacterium]MBP6861745.1 ATP-binding cassette domain-containing protein [Neisseriaceae bacterium]
MYQLHEVGFSVPSRILLHPLSATFQAGQVYGLVGHNGSGKSTLIKLLAKQQAPTTGQLLLNEQPMASWGARAFAQTVAYLPQHLPAAPGLSVRDLVLMGRYAWHGLVGQYARADFDQVDQALARTHTSAFADALVDQLSGGERQRVWLAMCLAQNTQFLLLDEPLAALDMRHQIEVMALVKTLAHTLNLGIVVVLHDINLAAQYCDQILALKGGALVHQGTPEEIMQPATLADIYGLQLHLVPHPVTKAWVAVP